MTDEWTQEQLQAHAFEKGLVMTARDELIEDLATKVPKADWDMADEIGDLSGVADAVLAAGWRKMPSAEALTDFIAEQRDAFPRRADDMDSGDLADAILALMDGDNE